jgi:hypothetical protein
MKEIGTFKIQDSFNVTLLGRIAVGEITSGIVKVNSYTHVKVNDKIILCQIKSVDLGKPVPGKDPLVGILLSSQELDLRDYKIAEQSIDIFDM